MIRTPSARARRSIGSASASARCTTCTRAPVSRAAAIEPRRSPSPRPRRDGRRGTGVARAGRLRRGRDHVGVLGVRDQQPVDGGQLGQRRPQPGVVQRRELRHTGVEQEALEPDDAGLEQRPELVDVAGHGAAPERDVGRDLAFRRLLVSRATPRPMVVGGIELRGMSTIVVTPPATAARVARGEALPLGAPGLVDVHVAVDQAGQQHLVVGQRDRVGRCVVERR